MTFMKHAYVILCIDELTGRYVVPDKRGQCSLAFKQQLDYLL